MATVAQPQVAPGASVAVDTKPKQKSKPVISPGVSLLSGGVAGAVEATATVGDPRSSSRPMSFDLGVAPALWWYLAVCTD